MRSMAGPAPRRVSQRGPRTPNGVIPVSRHAKTGTHTRLSSEGRPRRRGCVRPGGAIHPQLNLTAGVQARFSLMDNIVPCCGNATGNDCRLWPLLIQVGAENEETCQSTSLQMTAAGIQTTPMTTTAAEALAAVP